MLRLSQYQLVNGKPNAVNTHKYKVMHIVRKNSNLKYILMRSKLLIMNRERDFGIMAISSVKMSTQSVATEKRNSMLRIIRIRIENNSDHIIMHV